MVATHVDCQISSNYLETNSNVERLMDKKLHYKPVNILDTQTHNNTCLRTSPPGVNPLQRVNNKRSICQSEPKEHTKPTMKGMLIKRKKTNDMNRSEGRSLLLKRPAQKPSDVIEVIDSDEEDKSEVIAIESEEEDVILIHDRVEPADNEDSEVSRKRPKMLFPKSKKNLLLNKQTTFVDSGSISKEFSSLSCNEDDGVIMVSDVEDCSNDVEPNTCGKVTLSETVFVPVPEEYEPVVSPDIIEDYTPFISGCSRTDPVPLENGRYRVKPTRQLINVQESPPNTVTIPSSSFVTSTGVFNRKLSEDKNHLIVPKPPLVQQSIAQRKSIICKSVPPMKKLTLNEVVLNRLKAKKIIICKNNSVLKIRKLPVSSQQEISFRSPPSVTTLPSQQASCSTATVENKPDTVTLYHQNTEISETRKVQFTPMNSVNIELPGLSGPNVRRPKSLTNLKVLLPKRN